ncbi:hypothetical protein [Pseudooceanicola sp. HF7]|uniref:hypothetical protein n=1 Tax=Pseudooceanicola sp. HF7 TaxID=2721560 RepID=UPI0014321070|nr:hypothetical protein [Pseudooceanicola sp. HF7]NIZ11069.1 hypothetical protein [Pseudooceanicola sp. HF7]
MRILGVLALAVVTVMILSLAVNLVEVRQHDRGRLPNVDLTLDSMDFPAPERAGATTSLDNEDAEQMTAPDIAPQPDIR